MKMMLWSLADWRAFWDALYKKNIWSKAKIILYYMVFELLIHLTLNMPYKTFFDREGLGK